MYQGVQVCKQCGANLTLDDMRQTNCPYCGTVYPHQAMAVEHAAVVNQVMAQQGVPNALNPYQQGPQGPYGAGPQIGGVPYNQYVQGHVDAANRMVKVSLIVGLVITVAVIGVVVAVLLVAM